MKGVILLSVFSERVKEKRKERGWTQKELAEQLGLSVDTIKSWESRRKLPDHDNMKRLCLKLRTTEEYLLGGKDVFKEWLLKYDSEHQEELLKIRNEIKFYEYCGYLGCDISDLSDTENEEFKNQCNKSIKKIYKEIKERA